MVVRANATSLIETAGQDLQSMRCCSFHFLLHLSAPLWPDCRPVAAHLLHPFVCLCNVYGHTGQPGLTDHVEYAAPCNTTQRCPQRPMHQVVSYMAGKVILSDTYYMVLLCSNMLLFGHNKGLHRLTIFVTKLMRGKQTPRRVTLV